MLECRLKEEALRDLIRWGRDCSRRIYLQSNPSSVLAKIIEYGINVPSGYYDDYWPSDPRVTHTGRVIALLPGKITEVLTHKYVLTDTPETWLAKSCRLTKWSFRRHVQKGIDLYTFYFDKVDFAVFDVGNR